MSLDRASVLAERVGKTNRRIREELDRIGAPDREVVLVGVTKKQPASVVDALAAAGLQNMGENRVQEARDKIPKVRAEVRWHLIGPLQTNKAKRAAELFDTIHSVDSLRLLEALKGAALPREVFLQINVSGESTKSGARPEAAGDLLQAAWSAAPLRPVGLMTMAPYAEDPEEARPHFRALREILDDLNRQGFGPPMECLSMGMSADFTVAVQEGSTHVRIGRALTGGLPHEAPLDR